jgi:hypothetical protein
VDTTFLDPEDVSAFSTSGSCLTKSRPQKPTSVVAVSHPAKHVANYAIHALLDVVVSSAHDRSPSLF